MYAYRSKTPAGRAMAAAVAATRERDEARAALTREREAHQETLSLLEGTQAEVQRLEAESRVRRNWRVDYSQPCLECGRKMRRNSDRPDGATVRHASRGVCANCYGRAYRRAA